MLDVIRKILLDLKPAGADGFEGLVGEIIFGVSGIPSRLAKSGTQFGIDGDSAFPEDDICFEAKRYDGKLNKNEVVTKVAELGVYKDAADLLWVLGATTPIASQDATLLNERASLDGISILILDWHSETLPSLVLALVMAKERTLPFLRKVLDLDEGFKELEDACDWVIAHEDFAILSDKLRLQFSAVNLATENAKLANSEWLEKAFSEKEEASRKLGQPIAPLYDPNLVLPRSEVVEKTEEAMRDPHKPVFLLGEEGSGKSWVAALAMERFSGISIFLSADQLEGSDVSEDGLLNLVVTTLASQCGQGTHDETILKRWHKRLKGWQHTRESKRFLVVVDGLNQRPNVPWDKVINKLQGLSYRLGGCLVVTCRPKFFHAKIRKGLIETPALISIENWSEAERDKLLAENGVDVNLLDSTAATSLLNPRLLGIALEVLPLDNLEAWEGLTTVRLLFEHIRLSQRDNVESETADELARKISLHASQAIDKVRDTPPNRALLFQSDTEYVAEGRFYVATEGAGSRYRLQDEGLTLALGYALIDRIGEAYDYDEDLSEALAKLIEPISALDRTVDVFLASLMVCASDEERINDKIFVAILDGFTSLQNPDTQRYTSFRDICFTRFDAFLSSLENCFLDSRTRLNSDWLRAVAWDAKDDSELWICMSDSIDRWFGYYSKDPTLTLRPRPNDEKFKWDEKVKEKEEKINAAIDSLSLFESELLADMEENNGNQNQLISLALELLSDKPLAPFARSFLKWGLSLGINSDHWPPANEFQYLTNFNEIDWSEMCCAFRQILQSLDIADTSRGGRWTMVRMLYATGDHEDAIKAKRIAHELRNEEPQKGWRLVEAYCASDPCDPHSEKPENIVSTATRFKEIDVNELYKDRFLEATDDGRFLGDALLGVTRFQPKLAISKHKELLATWPNRTGESLGLLSLSCTALMPLIDANLARGLSDELINGENFKTVTENGKLAVLKVLWFISQHLEPKQQLDIMLLPEFAGSHYVMDMTSNFKPFQAKAFSEIFSDICSAGKKEEIIPALAFLRYTSTEWDDATTSNLVGLISHPDSMVRACVFDTILKNDFTQAIEVLCNSAWKAKNQEVEEYEAFYGSWLLVRAANTDAISFSDIFHRCSIKVLISAITSFKEEEQRVIVGVINASFNHLIKGASQTGKPVFEVVYRPNEHGGPSYYSLDGLNQMHQKEHLLNYESFEEYEARQKLLTEAFNEFKEGLDSNTALLTLDLFKQSDVDNITAIAPDLIWGWSRQLQKTNIHYFANGLCYLVAKVISEKAPGESRALFLKAKELDSFVSITYKNGLTLERKAIWTSCDDDTLESLRKSRLDNCENDYEIAMEVLAAETCGRADFIVSYVNEALGKEHPYQRARGIMVAGFSNQTDQFSDQINDAAQQSGLVGSVALVSLEAHKRCCWAKHWAKKMVDAKSAEDFWCASLLLAKIADGRLKLFLDVQASLGTYWTQYYRAISSETKARGKKWDKKRKETFLGIKSVDKVFM